MNEYKINNGLFSYIVNKAKCRHLKNLTCKGTLRQLFIRVYRLDIHSVKLIFSTQLCELLPLQPSLWFNSTQPPPCVNKCTVYIGREGGLRQINTYRKVPLLVNFFDDDILLWSLSHATVPNRWRHLSDLCCHLP